MSAKFEKGTRVGIVGGKAGKGMRGEVFWIGESRYGKGSRYGVRGDDGETYWIDEQHLGAETDVPEPQLPQRDLPVLAKGARVRITKGEGAGSTGEIFWVGESKFGHGMRYGVRADDGEETFWIDGPGVEAIEGESPAPEKKQKQAKKAAAREEFADDPRAHAPQSSAAPFDDDAPPPDDEDAPLEDDGFDDEPPF